MTSRMKLPETKLDVEEARALGRCSRDELAPHLPQLLAWVKDFNWPVAKLIAPTLAHSDDRIVPHIETILQGSDDTWKYWVLAEVVLRLDKPVRDQLMDEVVRIINQPTAGEVAEEVHLVAGDVMVLYGNEPD
ncbi:MAG: hypothetical protein ACI8S6_002968 [Myxococcota bacterium]|jgi:hypothetical protein